MNTGASMAPHLPRMPTGPTQATAGMNAGASIAAHPPHMPTGPTQATAGMNAGVSRAMLGACAHSAVSAFDRKMHCSFYLGPYIVPFIYDFLRTGA